MNFERFIAGRISQNKQSKGKLSESVVRIAVAAVAAGIAVMLISLSVTKGFKTEIFNKIVGFQSHIIVKNRDINTSFETNPVRIDSATLAILRAKTNVRHVQTYATKPGIVKTNNEIQGIVLKGIDADFDTRFFQEHIRSGKLITIDKTGKKNNKIVISQYLANILKTGLNDTLDFYFVQNPPRVRRFIVSGIYETGLEEFDKLFILCDIRHIQKLNGWDADQVSGYELYLDDFKYLEQATKAVRDELASHFTDDLSLLQVSNFKENNPAVIDWLNLSDMNIVVIITLMAFVAIFQMIAGMLVVILERTKMIGILKTLGAANVHIRKIFIINGVRLVFKGAIIGNVLAYSLLALQYYTRIMPLDASVYFTDAVPVAFSLKDFLLVNLGTFAATSFSLLIPALIIASISPAKSIQFD